MDQEAKINESVAAIKFLVGRLPDESPEVISEKWGREMVQDDDYPVLWELDIVPTNPNACRIKVLISSDAELDLTYGLNFDHQETIGKRLGLWVPKWRRHVIGFGTEPTSLSLDRVLKILSALFEGRLLLRYIPIGNILVDMVGEVHTVDGLERFGGGMLVSYFLGENSRYEPWNQAVLDRHSR